MKSHFNLMISRGSALLRAKVCGFRFALLIFCGGNGIAVAQSLLPSEVQADLLGRQISEALAREDVKAALAAFDQYHTLGVTIPPPLLFIEAKVAWAANDPMRAFEVLQDFLRVTDRDGLQYNEALTLYPSYENAAKAIQARVGEEQHLAEAAKAEANRRTLEVAMPSLIAGMEFVDIPAGSFRMGSRKNADEKPVHTVQLQGFRLMAHEVTIREWAVCVTAGACPEVDSRSEDLPVDGVSWDDIQSYISWLNGMTSGGYHLPTEAEWEYAARAGSTTDYSWGNSIDCSKASYLDCGGVMQVKSFVANAFGLYDMHGNVWEWVQDCGHGDYRGAPENGEAWVTGGDCSVRVLRGGAGFNVPINLRSAVRLWTKSAGRYGYYGFRLAQ
jgi:formylglycine-generating enzyme required for sulfatase activity